MRSGLVRKRCYHKSLKIIIFEADLEKKIRSILEMIKNNGPEDGWLLESLLREDLIFFRSGQSER